LLAPKDFDLISMIWFFI